MKDKKIITIVTLFTIIFTLIGGTLAYLNWSTNEAQKTNVTFTVTRDFSCAADGGGNISSTDNMLAPADCLNTNYAIQRTVTVTPTINRAGLTVYMDLWLNIEDIGTGLTNSDYFMYALTESPTSCVSNPKASGTFKGKVADDQIKLLDQEPYTTSGPKTYYLYIWLHKDETSTSTMNQSFNLTLGGQCSDLGIAKPIAPDLDNGMVPVVISNDGTVTTVSSTDDSWYDYNNKQWANVVLVNENATTGVEGSHSRSNYLANPGTEVAEEDILAYYVWIPRYSYRIPNVKCSTIEGVNETDYPGCYSIVLNNPDDKSSLIEGVYYLALQEGVTLYTMDIATKEIEEGLETGIFNSAKLGYSNVPMTNMLEIYKNMSGTRIEYSLEYLSNNNAYYEERTIDIKFATSTTEKETGDAVNTYRTHPAFTFGDTELKGIWVGKFETTGNENKPTILPNTEPLTIQNVSTQFQTSLKFSGGTLSNGMVTFGSNIYGLTNNADSHMMKNSEWGAVAYLSHSQYGINDEIRKNNQIHEDENEYVYYGTTTGCGALIENGEKTYNCEIEYGKSSSYPQSTTGNISGVFDMSGGTDEYVMGVLADSNGEPRSGNEIDVNSGFNGLLSDDTPYEAGIDFPDYKYYDLYTSESPITACNGGKCYGHALHETGNWYSDSAFFVRSNKPWFSRGGTYGSSDNAGIFYSGVVNGGEFLNVSFRSVAIKGA